MYRRGLKIGLHGVTAGEVLSHSSRGGGGVREGKSIALTMGGEYSDEASVHHSWLSADPRLNKSGDSGSTYASRALQPLRSVLKECWSAAGLPPHLLRPQPNQFRLMLQLKSLQLTNPFSNKLLHPRQEISTSLAYKRTSICGNWSCKRQIKHTIKSEKTTHVARQVRKARHLH